MTYDPEPTYRVQGGRVQKGYAALAAEITRSQTRVRDSVLAVDGPAALPWDDFAGRLAGALRAAGLTVVAVDLRAAYDWDEVRRRTAGGELLGDPVFARLSDRSLAELVTPPRPRAEDADVTLVFGPGSALVEHGLLWYADVPKRVQLAAVRGGGAPNLGQPPGGAGSEQRLLFVDWPVQERHVRELAARLDAYLDLTDVREPRLLEGAALRSTLERIAGGPFRTRPTFLPGAWGGQWLRERLEIETAAPNLAWSYELIAPEASLLLGNARGRVEVSFELLLAEQGDSVLGAEVAARYGGAFPIRFDYLDTMGGGDLSIQCHPSVDYMRSVFGGTYTQDESYYVVETTPGARIFLGLRDDADPAAFERDARAALDGVPFEPERYLQAQPAVQHALYLIPAGTPHASGAGNLVLEISATPYLYTLRFYDWLRRDLDGTLRPVHVDHAFANLDPSRRGAAVQRELMQEPRELRADGGARELVLGELPELFYAVHRLEFDDAIEDDTAGRFHVLNVVDGGELLIETAGGLHPLSYAETVVVPAACGPYRLRSGGPCKVVKAFVR